MGSTDHRPTGRTTTKDGRSYKVVYDFISSPTFSQQIKQRCVNIGSLYPKNVSVLPMAATLPTAVMVLDEAATNGISAHRWKYRGPHHEIEGEGKGDWIEAKARLT